MRNKRRMPTKKQIVEHWRPRWSEFNTFDSAGEMSDDICFACGIECKPERAHIKARFECGYDDSAENLHLLCWMCHLTTEKKSGREYWEYVKTTNMMNRGFSRKLSDAISQFEKDIRREIASQIMNPILHDDTSQPRR